MIIIFRFKMTRGAKTAENIDQWKVNTNTLNFESITVKERFFTVNYFSFFGGELNTNNIVKTRQTWLKVPRVKEYCLKYFVDLKCGIQSKRLLLFWFPPTTAIITLVLQEIHKMSGKKVIKICSNFKDIKSRLLSVPRIAEQGGNLENFIFSGRTTKFLVF